MTTLIGLRGIIGSGKTTIAKELNKLIINSEIKNFAKPMKDALKELGISKESHPELARKLLQFIGGECRKEDSDFWVKLAKEKIHQSYCNFIIFDDVRHENEISLFNKPNYLFNIYRQEAVDKMEISMALDEDTYFHESERFNARNLKSGPGKLIINNKPIDEVINEILGHIE